MNKKLLLLALAGSSLVAASAHAADGTINFTGKIEATTCSITGSGGAAGTGPLTVTLDTLSKAAFGAAGSIAGKKAFGIGLSGSGCVASKAYTMAFSGTQIDATTGNLKPVAGTGTATNLALQLQNAAGGIINLNTQANAPTVTTSATGTGTLAMSVAYLSTAATVGEGSVSSTVDFVLSHN